MIEFIIAILLITIVALVGSQAAQEKLTRNLTSRAMEPYKEPQPASRSAFSSVCPRAFCTP